MKLVSMTKSQQAQGKRQASYRKDWQKELLLITD
jgi:hypothetical protein